MGMSKGEGGGLFHTCVLTIRGKAGGGGEMRSLTSGKIDSSVKKQNCGSFRIGKKQGDKLP